MFTITGSTILRNEVPFVPIGVNVPLPRYIPGDMTLVKNLGANIVRIVVPWYSQPRSKHDAYDPAAPGNFSVDVRAALQSMLAEAKIAGLAVVLAISGCDGDFFANSAVMRQFLNMWVSIAIEPGIDFCEILSEPQGILGQAAALYNEAIDLVEAKSPASLFIVGPQGYAVRQYRSMKPVGAVSNVVYTFDFYNPEFYVLQLVNKTPKIVYPGPNLDKEYLQERLDFALEFSSLEDVPIWCNQVGVPWATPGSAAWIADALAVLAPVGFCWWVLRVSNSTGVIPGSGTTNNSMGDYGFYGMDAAGNWQRNEPLVAAWTAALSHG